MINGRMTYAACREVVQSSEILRNSDTGVERGGNDKRLHLDENW